jgi:S1-C subfamily serine protease
MVRALVLVAVVFVIPRPLLAQTLGVLHIRIVLNDVDGAVGKTTPVPGHALLISDNPSTAPPRLVRTAVDGTADVRLRPGNYTVESDRPVAFNGKAYQWTQTVDVVAGRDAVLQLTTGNADVAVATSETTAGARPLEADPAFLMPRWQDSVVALWTPSTHASGFIIDSRGLVATNQKAIGAATSVEVQLTSTVKVPARVLATDAAKDVAVLWIDPRVITSVTPIPLGCGHQAPALEDKQEIFTIGIPLRQLKDMTSGTVSDLGLLDGSAGGPVFTADGTLVGITSPVGKNDDRRRGRTTVVRTAAACDVVTSVEQKMTNATPPSGAHLPIEPAWPLPEEAFKDAAQHRAGSLNPYPMASSSFDVAFITPVMIFGSTYQADQMNRRGQGPRTTGGVSALVSRLMDFGNWSDYLEGPLPVLLVRVTPKMVENFWTTVARGAALTQGAAIPAIKRAKSGFSRLRAYCGDSEVAPIHPFVLEQRVSDKDTIAEGLYVFDPGALGPQCDAVKLVLYSDKDPERGETRVVDPGILQRIAQDFAPYRDTTAATPRR